MKTNSIFFILVFFALQASAQIVNPVGNVSAIFGYDCPNTPGNFLGGVNVHYINLNTGNTVAYGQSTTNQIPGTMGANYMANGTIQTNSSFILNMVLSKNNDWTNGVSTFDSYLIYRQALGLPPISSYPMDFARLIAADVNNSATITTLDVVDLRKLILAITTSLPDRFPTTWAANPNMYPNTLPIRSLESWRIFSNTWLANFEFSNLVCVNPLDISGENIPLGFQYPYYIDPINTFITQGATQISMSQSLFSAVKVGDLNNTADVSGFTNKPVATDRQLVVQTPEHSNEGILKGESFQLVLELDQIERLAGFQLGFSFNEDAIEIESISSLNGFSEDNYHVANGEIRVSWFEETTTKKTRAASSSLLVLNLKALDDIKNIEADLSINEQVLASEFFSFDAEIMTNSTIEMKTIHSAGNEVTKVEVSPNPFKDQFTFNFKLEKAEKVQFNLYDMQGRLIASESSIFPKGENRFTMNDQQFANTCLLYTIESTSISARGKLVKME